MKNKINEKKLNKRLWNLLNDLRADARVEDFIDILTTLFFYKYISDLNKINKLEEINLTVSPELEFNKLLNQINSGNLGDQLNKIFVEIEELNQPQLENILSYTDYSQYRRESLVKILMFFNEIDFGLMYKTEKQTISDTFNFLVEIIIKQMGRRGGEFITPKSINQLLSKIISANSKNSIYNPICGFGRSLIRFAKDNDIASENIYGNEINFSAYRICILNLFINGFAKTKIVQGNPLVSPTFLENGKLKQFDISLGCPPFMTYWNPSDISVDKENTFRFGVPSKRGGTYAFINLMYNTLSKSGKAAIIVPNGTLFRRGRDGDILKAILAEKKLDCVVSLPTKLFTNTSIATALLIFNKAKSNNEVLFIKADEEYEKNTSQNLLTNTNIEKIVNTYKDYKTVENYSKLIKYEDLLNNELNLDPKFYVDKPSFKSKGEEIDTVKLSDIADLFKGVHIKKEDRVDSSDWYYLLGRDIKENSLKTPTTCIKNDIAEKYIQKLIMPGDIVLFTHFDTPKIAVVKPDFPNTIASNMITVLRPKKVHSKYLYRFLSSNTGKEIMMKQLSRISKGSVIKYVNLKDLSNLEIPLLKNEDLVDAIISDNLLDKKNIYERELHRTLKDLLIKNGWGSDNLFVEHRIGKYIYDLVIKENSEIKYIFEVKSSKATPEFLSFQLESLSNELKDSNIQLYILTESGIKKFDLNSEKLSEVKDLPTPTK